MKTRITLNIETETLKKAIIYSTKNNLTLSNIIEKYLRVLIKEYNTDIELTPTVKKLLGSVKAPKKFDYKKILEERGL